MRIVAAFLFSIAASGANVVLAQSGSSAGQRTDAPMPQENPEEVIVRGRRLGELRFEIEQARIRAYDIFNEINSDDDFDVYCQDRSRSGTRMPQQVCRARFEDRISSGAGQEYIATLRWRCPDPEGLTQDCIFSDYSSSAISAAQGVEGEAPGKRQRLKQEITRLANENDEFAQAILDWYEANQLYEAERQRRRAD
jgi:hypothetical protein